MTREQYICMTSRVRRATNALPGGAAWLRLPTYLCAAAYLFTLLYLMLMRDVRLIRTLWVPAICFAAVTLLRPAINRERPYDHFDTEPVGPFVRGKRKGWKIEYFVFLVIYIAGTILGMTLGI